MGHRINRRPDRKQEKDSMNSFNTLARNAFAGVASLFLAVTFVGAATAPALVAVGNPQVATLSA